MKTWDEIQKDAKKGPLKKNKNWFLNEKERLVILAVGKLVEEVQRKVVEDFHDGDKNYDCDSSLCKASKEFNNIK